MKSEDYKIEREEAFCDDWYMTRNMKKTPTYADAIEWADQHPNWIKVTDRMPELIDHCAYSVYVLVCYTVQYQYMGTIRYTRVACYDYKEKGWFTHNDEQIDGEVTHWMPIVLPNED